MSRRAPGEGTVYQRRDGIWCAQVSVKNDLGVTKRATVYARTRRDVLAKRKHLLNQAAQGVSVTSRPPTLREYGRQWLNSTLQYRWEIGDLAETTLMSYGLAWRNHIDPLLGHLRLDEITPDKVRSWQRQKGSETNAHGRPHSPRSLQNMHGVLRMALNEALRDGLISANPVLRVPAPRGSAGKIRPLSGDEMRLLLQQAASCPLYPLWVTLLATGLRVGEALALHWSDLDLERQTITVNATLARVGGQVDPATGRRSATRLTRKATKTAASQATVAVPRFAVDVLRRHRLHQAEERLAARAWNDNNVIFSTEIGTFLEQRNVLRRFKALAADAGIVRNVRVHDLRHTTASHMIDAGVPLVVVQATLRHTRVATTADVYTHQLAEVHRSGATAMDARLRSVSGDPA